MVRKKSDDEIFKDEPKDSEPSDDYETSKIKKPPAYRDMTDAQYIKCKTREEFAMMAQSDKHGAVQYLRRKEDYFRRTFTKEEKEILHRGIMSGGCDGLSSEDARFLRDVFGSLQPCKMTPSNTQYSESASSYREPSTTEGWMRELMGSTFVRFRKMMNSPSFKLNVLDKLDDVGRDLLCELIEHQLRTRYVLSFQEKENFEDSDMVWINQV